MKKLLLVDSDKESSFVLSKQLEFDKKYVVHQAIGYQELQEFKEDKKITDIILINIHICMMKLIMLLKEIIEYIFIR